MKDDNRYQVNVNGRAITKATSYNNAIKTLEYNLDGLTSWNIPIKSIQLINCADKRVLINY